MKLEEMLLVLPNLNLIEGDGNNIIIVGEDEGYMPTLYKYDGDWHLDWMSQDAGDSLIDFYGSTPTEVITKAYDFYLNLKCI